LNDPTVNCALGYKQDLLR